MPWEVLQLREIHLPELKDLSSIAKTAGHNGGAVMTTLAFVAKTLDTLG